MDILSTIFSTAAIIFLGWVFLFDLFGTGNAKATKKDDNDTGLFKAILWIIASPLLLMAGIIYLIGKLLSILVPLLLEIIILLVVWARGIIVPLMRTIIHALTNLPRLSMKLVRDIGFIPAKLMKWFGKSVHAGTRGLLTASKLARPVQSSIGRWFKLSARALFTSLHRTARLLVFTIHSVGKMIWSGVRLPVKSLLWMINKLHFLAQLITHLLRKLWKSLRFIVRPWMRITQALFSIISKTVTVAWKKAIHSLAHEIYLANRRISKSIKYHTQSFDDQLAKQVKRQPTSASTKLVHHSENQHSPSSLQRSLYRRARESRRINTDIKSTDLSWEGRMSRHNSSKPRDPHLWNRLRAIGWHTRGKLKAV